MAGFRNGRHRYPARISFGVARWLAMLTADFDVRLSSYLSNNRCGVCIRAEVAIPREPIAAFVPHHLRLAYGLVFARLRTDVASAGR